MDENENPIVNPSPENEPAEETPLEVDTPDELLSGFSGYGGEDTPPKRKKPKSNLILVIVAVVLAAAIITACLLLFTNGSGKKSSEPLAASINGRDYSVSQITPYLSLSLQNLQSYIGEFDWTLELSDGTTAADYVLSDALEIIKLYAAIEAQAGELGIVLTDEDKESIASFHDDAIESLGSEAAYEAELLSSHMTRESYEYIYTINILYNYIYDYYYGENGSDLPSDEEVLQWAGDNSIMHANHILLSFTDKEGKALTDEDKAAQYALAEELLQRIADGEDFDSLSAKYSYDGGLQDYYFTEGETVASFEAAVKELEPGEVSGIVESEYGYHIIKRLPVEVSYILTNSSLLSDRFNVMMNEWVEKLDISVTDYFYSIDPQVALN